MMGKINGCLKCLFIFFNILFAIIGCLLIYGAVKANSYQVSSVGTPGIGWVWVLAIGVVGISSLGIFAGCSENALTLKIFAGFMVAGMIIMLIFGIVVAVTRNKFRDVFTDASSERAKAFMQEEGFKTMLNESQSDSKCCGLGSPLDWGSEIPDSCACDDSSGGLGGGCKVRPEGTTGPPHIYNQACGDYIFQFIDIFLKITMGILFGFAVTALLGLLVTLLMLHQIKRHDDGGPAISMKSY